MRLSRFLLTTTCGIALCMAFSPLIPVPAVEAKTPVVTIRDGKSYAAKFVSQSEKDPIILEAGSTKTINIQFKNIGTATWDAAGNRFISAYTMEPRERASAFKGNNWISAKQTGKISGAVKPGQTGTLALTIKAPEKEGTYTEKFYLSAENYSWVKGGYFFLTFKVSPKKTIAPAPAGDSITPTPASPVSAAYKGKKIGQTITSVTAKGGEEVRVIVMMQNTGKQAWPGYAFVANSPTGLASVTKLSFAHESWANASTPIQRDQTVAPDGVVREEFSFRAPTLAGEYVARFSMQTSGQPIDQGMAEINILVTENAPLADLSPAVPAADTTQTPPRLEAEPRIRVGMELKMAHVQFKSDSDIYRILVSGNEIGTIPQGQLAVFRFENGAYTLTSADLTFQNTDPFRVEPVNDPHAVYELVNYEKFVNWKGPHNFNKYRGAFEYRQGKVDKLMYAVDDVLLEDYVAGIAETSNLAPYEYIKALLTAARTYAYVSKGKYPFFDVVANTYDQLYLGYNSELLMPKVAQASRDTRGKMITYNNDVVVTPYFANSTGSTKSWQQVWGGRSAKPWLVPVVAEYDRGQPMRGHGVGMSARDAAERADKEGMDWVGLVKHYYTGVELTNMYQ